MYRVFLFLRSCMYRYAQNTKHDVFEYRVPISKAHTSILNAIIQGN